MKSFRVSSPDSLRLDDFDTADTQGMSEAECADRLSKNRPRIAELQNALYAEGRRSLLVVLQAMDTGGKDPIIRDVLYGTNQQACRVTAFKKANADEEKRDRFWRFHQHVPAKGEIGVFNRSYFDDMIREDAHGDLDDDARKTSLAEIITFERMLSEQNIKVIKLFLHISKEEQRRRLQERIDDPHRHWELSESDFTERKYWDGYMRAYEHAIRETHTENAPWYVLTSDRKWFRDAAASEVIRTALEEIDPQYPPPKVDLSTIEWH